MDSPYRRELEAAIAVVEQAARISQAVLPAQDKGVVDKADNLGPVTIGDFAIQALLTASLQAAFPGDAFVGEEDAGALRADAALCDRVWATLNAVVAGGSSSGGVCLPASREAMCDAIDRCQGAPGPGRVWVFDPIDGTKTFVRREMYAINVALLVDGQQTVAVVACPLLSPDEEEGEAEDGMKNRLITNDTVDPTGRGSLLFAVRGYGTYVRPLFSRPGPGAAVAAAAAARKLARHATTAGGGGLRPVTCFAMQTSALDEVHQAVAARLGTAFPGSDLLGWVPRWAALATGRANATVWVYKRRGRHAKVWDHAGAMLLFEEVGGVVTDVDGRPLDLLAGRTLRRNFGFVAAPADVHGAVLAAVRAVLRELGRLDLLGEA